MAPARSTARHMPAAIRAVQILTQFPGAARIQIDPARGCGRRLDRERANEGYPYASLIFDGAGALYGTTQVCGIIFAIRPGLWRRRLRYSGRGVGRDRAAQLRQRQRRGRPRLRRADHRCGGQPLRHDQPRWSSGPLLRELRHDLQGRAGWHREGALRPQRRKRRRHSIRWPDRRRVGQSLRHDERWRRNVRLLPLW